MVSKKKRIQTPFPLIMYSNCLILSRMELSCSNFNWTSAFASLDDVICPFYHLSPTVPEAVKPIRLSHLSEDPYSSRRRTAPSFLRRRTRGRYKYPTAPSRRHSRLPHPPLTTASKQTTPGSCNQAAS
jgi:hypothetical protein